MALLPNFGPPLEQTHELLPMEEMEKLRNAIQAKANEARVTFTMVEEVARDNEVPVSHVYAGMSLDPNLVPDLSQDVLIAVCTSTCQLQGAIANIEELVQLRKQRVAEGKAAFDIVPRQCLDMCAHAPVAITRSPMGTAAHPRLQPEHIPDMISTLCDS